MVNLDPIRKRLGADFRPFIISLTAGRQLRVPHPDFIAVGRGIVSVIDENDTDHLVDALHIASIDEVESDGQAASESR